MLHFFFSHTQKEPFLTIFPSLPPSLPRCPLPHPLASRFVSRRRPYSHLPSLPPSLPPFLPRRPLPHPLASRFVSRWRSHHAGLRGQRILRRPVRALPPSLPSSLPSFPSSLPSSPPHHRVQLIKPVILTPISPYFPKKKSHRPTQVPLPPSLPPSLPQPHLIPLHRSSL